MIFVKRLYWVTKLVQCNGNCICVQKRRNVCHNDNMKRSQRSLGEFEDKRRN